MDRSISPNEVTILSWLLDHARVDVSTYRARPLEELRCWKLRLWMSSLYFQSPDARGKLEMLADELAVYPDGKQAGLILWGRAGEIAWLEVYDLQPESSHRTPDVAHLCTWDEFGRRDLERSRRRH